jgi:hypothetical protein
LINNNKTTNFSLTNDSNSSQVLKYIQSDMDTLKKSTRTMMEMLISATNKAQINNTLYGGDYMSVQYSSNIQYMKQTAKDNGLSTIDLTNCLNKLRNSYNLSSISKLVMEKWDMNTYLVNVSNINKDLASNYLSFSVYSAELDKKLDTSFCENETVPLQIPLKNVESINLPFYRKLANQSVDIFDPQNLAFTSRCGSIVDSDIQADTSQNYRRTNYYQNKSLNCFGAQCNYYGIGEDNYVNCNCTSMNDEAEVNNDFLNIVLGAVTNFNFDVVACIKKAFSYV